MNNRIFDYISLYIFYNLRMNSPRGIYVNLLKSQRKQSIEKIRQAYLGNKNHQNLKISIAREDRSLNGRELMKTERQKSLNKLKQTNRQSTTSRGDKKSFSKQRSAKKNQFAWHKTCASLSKETYDDQRKKNLDGINCRIVILNNGKTQKQHFIQIVNTKDVGVFLKQQYPRILCFSTVPRQLSLEYMFTQQQICGKFLNGQSIYLKPQIAQRQNTQKISLEDFQILKQIGSGGFSKVFLCKSKIDCNFYAMKLIEKDMVVKNKKKNIIMNERNIMKATKHPFIIDLKYAFQVEKYIVFIMEYCPGGELFGLIKRYHRLSEDMVKFYIIQIFLGLSYLHQNKVVYRDIKPQNILLGIDGHIKIADLGLAKPDMFEGELAYSFCGSPEYMSPQMIMQVGHTYPVDYYCMGALMYELLTGLPPFYSQDPNQIYQAVLMQDLTFPEDVQLTHQCKSLLRALLTKDPKKRLGSLYGTKQILAHPWFGKRNYKNFVEKVIQPPLNFKNIQKINLDYEINAKDKESLQKVLKDQKTKKKQYRQIMKQFYYDCFAENRPKSARNPKILRQKSPKNYKPRHNSKQNVLNSIRKMKKICSTQLLSNKTLQLFNR